MAKPLITFRSDTDPYPLTYTELDTNFQNLRDATISVSDSTNTAVLDLNDTLNVVGSGGATVSVNPATKTLTVSTADTVNAFQTIAVSGQSNIVADATNDTLTLVAGSNITITTDPTTDSVTIASTSGSGTVNTGVSGRLAYYPSNGTTIDDTDVIFISGSNTVNINGTLQGQGATAVLANLGITTSLDSDAGLVNFANGASGTRKYVRIRGQYGSTAARVDVGRDRSGSSTSNIYLQPGASGNIILEPSGTDTTVTVTTDSTTDLVLNTNNGTNSGSITIADGANNDITIAPNGTGAVVIDGEVDINANIASTPVNTTTVAAWLEVGSNGSVYYLPLYQ